MYPYADSIKDLTRYISQIQRINYRFMVEKLDKELKVTRLIIGGPEAKWKSYDYSEVFFRAGTEYGTKVADWLASGTIATRCKETFPILPINILVNCTRHPSHSQGGLFTLLRTFTMYSGSFSQAVPSRNYEFASARTPFFFALWEAERHLLYDIPEDSLSHASHTPTAGIYVYLEHDDAWLEKIHFSLTSLDIHMEGESLIGATLRVVGSGIEEYNRRIDQQDVSIPLPNGRPDYLKIAILGEETWLDYFVDDRRFPPNQLNPMRKNVTFAEPEPQEKIRELIDRGEGRTIEFKYSLKSCSNRIKWLKTIIAFANGEGGSLIIGVNDEDGAIIGIEEDIAKYDGNIARFEDEITNAISDVIDPVPEYNFMRAVIEDKDILVVNVEPSDGKCHAAYENKKFPVFYIRRGATTRIADHNEVQELVRLKSPSLPLQQASSPFIGHINQE